MGKVRVKHSVQKPSRRVCACVAWVRWRVGGIEEELVGVALSAMHVLQPKPTYPVIFYIKFLFFGLWSCQAFLKESLLFQSGLSANEGGVKIWQFMATYSTARIQNE